MDGSYHWTKVLSQSLTKVRINSNDEVLVCGRYQETMQIQDENLVFPENDIYSKFAFLIKYSGDGGNLWLTTWYLGDGNGDVTDFVINRNNDIFVGNMYLDRAAGSNRTTKVSKFGNDGNFISEYDIFGGQARPSIVSLHTDSADQIIISGMHTKNTGHPDIVDFDPGPEEDLHASYENPNVYVVSISEDMSFNWAITFDEPEHFLRIWTIHFDNESNMYCVGKFSGTVDFDPGEGTELRTFNGFTQYTRTIYTLKLTPAVLNVPPVADAGTDQWVRAGDKVRLDGTRSYDPDGGPDAITYQWSPPFGVELDDSTSPTPQFLAPKHAGIYTFSLSVFDGKDWSEPDTVDVRVNAKPIANGGPDIRVERKDSFILDGSNSFDSDHGPGTLSYRWSSLDFKIENPNDPRIKLETPQKVGTYSVTLSVFDGMDWSLADKVVIEVVRKKGPSIGVVE